MSQNETNQKANISEHVIAFLLAIIALLPWAVVTYLIARTIPAPWSYLASFAFGFWYMGWAMHPIIRVLVRLWMAADA